MFNSNPLQADCQPSRFGPFPSFSYSLNNGTADAGSKCSKWSPSSGPGYQSADFTILGSVRSGYASRQKRILLESLLTARYLGVRWSSGFWQFIKTYGQEAKRIFGISDSSIRKRATFFDWCYRPKTKGYVLPSMDGETYYDRNHCGEPGCLLCADRARRRIAGEWYEVKKQVVENHPEGFKGFLDLNFTLPEELEGIPLKDRKIERALLDAEQGIAREIFGLNSRSNVAMNVVVHPIGSRDLFRDRWHSDVGVIPGVVEGGRFQWVEPVKVARDKGHRPNMWRLDLGWLRERWLKDLSRIFGRPVKGIQPQVCFVPSPVNTWYWQERMKPGESPSDAFWRKVRHTLKYTLRSFSQDFENAVLRTDAEGKRFVVKGSDSKWDFWQVVSARFLVDRYRWARGHNLIRARGWAQVKNKYRDVLGLVGKDVGCLPEVLSVVRADVSLIREKHYDTDKKKVVWNRDEVYRFVSPVTGKDEACSIKDMKPWQWGKEAYLAIQTDLPVDLSIFGRPSPSQGRLFGDARSRGPPGGQEVSV